MSYSNLAISSFSGNIMLREVTENEKWAFVKTVLVIGSILVVLALFCKLSAFSNQMFTKVFWYKINLKNSLGLLIFFF